MDPERKHAIEVRFLGRLHWMSLGVALIVGWGVPHGLPRALLIGALTAAGLGLSLPAFRVARRAAKEGAPAHLVRALWVPVVLRGLATMMVAAMLAG